MRARSTNDRGEALIGYALIGMLIGVAGIGALKMVGQSTSDSFEAVSTSIAGSTVEVELTPKEKWDKAKADYQATMADAKATKADTVANAKATYQAEVAANESLSNKAGKQAANKQAKADFNTAKKQATNTYEASVSAAKSAKAVAKAEYKATK